MPPPSKRWCASDVWRRRLSVAYIGPKSRTERPTKTKIDTKVAYVTRTPFSRSKGQRPTCRGGGILWRPSAQLVLFHLFWDTHTDLHWILAQTMSLNVPDRFLFSARIHRGFVHQFSTRCTWQHVNVDSIFLNYQASGFVYSFNVNYFVLPCYVQLITAKTDLLNAWFIFFTEYAF